MNRLTEERLEVLLDGIRRVRILVIGDLMLDVYLRGAASRISPEAPVPVVRVDEQWRALGGAANVAANAVALGASCAVIGCVGNDAAGAELRHELERAGIDARGIVATEGRPTTVKTRIMARRQQIARYDLEEDGEIDEGCVRSLRERIHEAVAAADAVVLEDYNKGVLAGSVVTAALEAATLANKPVIVDPKARLFFDYRGATVFKPNEPELMAALRTPVMPDDADWMERTRRALGCENLLLTLGDAGMALITAQAEHVRVPAVARSVYDVSGAGDTVSAVVAVGLAAGADVVEAAILANHAAGVEVAKAGVATVSADELRSAVADRLAERHG